MLSELAQLESRHLLMCSLVHRRAIMLNSASANFLYCGSECGLNITTSNRFGSRCRRLPTRALSRGGPLPKHHDSVPALEQLRDAARLHGRAEQVALHLVASL